MLCAVLSSQEELECFLDLLELKSSTLAKILSKSKAVATPSLPGIPTTRTSPFLFLKLTRKKPSYPLLLCFLDRVSPSRLVALEAGLNRKMSTPSAPSVVSGGLECIPKNPSTMMVLANLSQEAFDMYALYGKVQIHPDPKYSVVSFN
ncbi:MAG: hypothetical protein EOP04_16620 [Proteobacteria bacterium]|nr:MAG: hypothetical protein EOP04_16620 [Pseudomonadota bacterium]